MKENKFNITGAKMNKKILVTIIVLIFIGNLFAEIPGRKIQLSPFLHFEKNLFSTLEIEHELNEGFTRKKIEIFMVDHLSLGCKIQRSLFFAVFNNILSWNKGKTIPIYFDVNVGINYRNYSTYLGRVFNMKHHDTEMLETYYFGINSNWLYKRSDIMCNIQFIDGNYKNCSDQNESFSAVAMNLQLSYAFKELYPYGSFSISNLHYQFVMGISLLSPPMIKNNTTPVLIYDNQSLDYSEKPNIYLYPEEECIVEVALKPNGKITKSIPEYNDGWKVHIKPSGIINNEYTFLFYEAEVNVGIPESGWCIDVNELNNFFRNILVDYGLNETEIKDFIEYWSKRLNRSSYYCIYPLLNDDLINICSISIDPKPDNILRLWFIFTPVEQYKTLDKPIIPVFSRKGFEVIEWGGILQE